MCGGVCFGKLIKKKEGPVPQQSPLLDSNKFNC